MRVNVDKISRDLPEYEHSALILGENGVIPGVTFSFSSIIEDEGRAIRGKSNQFRGNRVTLIRRKVGSA